jgi:hypothetical protein
MATSLSAEYRVYLLNLQLLKDKNKMIISTLDNIQFPGWYRGIRVEKIDLLDSWVCFGDTSGFKPPCDKPVSGSNNVKDK